MNPIQSHPGSYWHSDDAADIWLNTFAAEKPETIKVFESDASESSSGLVTIPLAPLRFINAGIFGEGRPCSFNSKSKWTGDSHRYGVYFFEEDPNKQHPVILETHGGGTQGVMFPSYTTDLWSVIAVGLLPEQLWDMCHNIMQYGANMQRATEKRIHSAFVEDRLIKRRRHGNVYVETKPVEPLL